METLIATPRTSLLVAAFGLVAGIGGERALNTPGAPKIDYACYVPLTGSVYRIKQSDARQACTSPSHVEFSWIRDADICRVAGAARGNPADISSSAALARLFGRPLGTTRSTASACLPTGHATRELDAASSPEL